MSIKKVKIKKVKIKKVKLRFYTFGRWNAFLYSTWILSSPFAFPSLKNGRVMGTNLDGVFNYSSFLSSFFTLVKKIDRTFLFIYGEFTRFKEDDPPSLKTTRNGQDVLQKLYII
jgi:hypothetical protein